VDGLSDLDSDSESEVSDGVGDLERGDLSVVLSWPLDVIYEVCGNHFLGQASTHWYE
jgi:hypothetical protein